MTPHQCFNCLVGVILDRSVWHSSYSRLGFLVIKVNNKGFADSQGLINPTDTPAQVEGFPLLTVSTRQIQEEAGDSLLKKQLGLADLV
ncbi:hypothetical protein Tco_0001185 [Tanacetum coccineum]